MIINSNTKQIARTRQRVRRGRQMPGSVDDAEACQFEESSGNVFADLGLENAEELDVKARLAQVIRERIRARGLTQTDAARLLGTDQGKVSQVLNGKIAGFTYDRLLRFLNALECDIEIRVIPRGDARRAAQTMVSTG